MLVALAVGFVVAIMNKISGLLIMAVALHMSAFARQDEVQGSSKKPSLLCMLIPSYGYFPECEDDDGLKDRVLRALLLYSRMFVTFLFLLLYLVAAWNVFLSLAFDLDLDFEIFNLVRLFVVGLASIGAGSLVTDDGGLVRRDSGRREAVAFTVFAALAVSAF